MTLYGLNNVEATSDCPKWLQPETILFPLRIRELCQTCLGGDSLMLRHLGSLEILLPSPPHVPLTIILPLVSINYWPTNLSDPVVIVEGYPYTYLRNFSFLDSAYDCCVACIVTANYAVTIHE